MSGLTTWHITWGTYGTRLHGGDRPTVDRRHNQRGQAFIAFDPPRYERCVQQMKFPPVLLDDAQRVLIERALPSLCERGGWLLREWAAQPDHVHVLADVRKDVHGEKVRRLLKRWLTQALNAQWEPGSGRPGSLPEGGRWWAEQGSNRVVDDEHYLRNCIDYIRRQHTTV